MDVEDNIQNTFYKEHVWKSEHESIFIEWADKAMCYRWLHAKANKKYSILTKWFSIPVIIISTLTGTANFAQSRIPEEYIAMFVMLVGALNLLAGIISTIQQFLKINELNESHRVSSISWDKFYRNIKIELSKDRDERIPVGQMLKIFKEEYDRLMETSPVIGAEIIAKFKKTFKNSKYFDSIRKPEICDELISTKEILFKPKNDKKTSTISSPSSNVSIMMNKLVNNIKTKSSERTTIKNFINNFINIHNRKPLIDEVLTSLDDVNPDLVIEILNIDDENNSDSEKEIINV